MVDLNHHEEEQDYPAGPIGRLAMRMNYFNGLKGFFRDTSYFNEKEAHSLTMLFDMLDDPTESERQKAREILQGTTQQQMKEVLNGHYDHEVIAGMRSAAHRYWKKVFGDL